MSTATVVPVADRHDGHSALQTVRSYGLWRLTVDTYSRLRYADGFSHSRALAYQLVLTVIPGVIIAVALGVVIGSNRLQTAVSDTINSFVPGTAATMFQAAVEQGTEAGGEAITGGGIAFAIAGVTSFSQIQRTASRTYGVEADRPTLIRYWLAIRLALTAGILLLAFFAAVGIGSATPFVEDGTWTTIWRIARWPIGFVVLGVAYALIFKIAPNRTQPTLSWLAVGATISTVGTLAVSIVLSFYLEASVEFGQTYGVFAGLIGLRLWAYATAIAMFAGLAVAAQLEAARSGTTAPRSADKIAASTPPATNEPESTEPSDLVTVQ